MVVWRVLTIMVKSCIFGSDDVPFSGDTWRQYVLGLVMETLVTWLWWCSPDLSTRKFCFSLCNYSLSYGEILWGSVDLLCFIIYFYSLNLGSINPAIINLLPATIFTVVFAKWWFLLLLFLLHLLIRMLLKGRAMSFLCVRIQLFALGWTHARDFTLWV